ncbi:MarR family winged helix-turn-helix transcriptional regulator [Stenotrophomonas humi]
MNALKPTTRKETPAELMALAERLRSTIGNFVRAVRTDSDTPTNAQSETLAALDRHGAMSVAQLAAARNVKHQSMRVVVEQLEREGLIKKSNNPQDRRSQLITPTCEGRAALGDDRRQRMESIARALRDCTTSEERQILHSAIGLLERIASAPN